MRRLFVSVMMCVMVLCSCGEQKEPTKAEKAVALEQEKSAQDQKKREDVTSIIDAIDLGTGKTFFEASMAVVGAGGFRPVIITEESEDGSTCKAVMKLLSRFFDEETPKGQWGDEWGTFYEMTREKWRQVAELTFKVDKNQREAWITRYVKEDGEVVRKELVQLQLSAQALITTLRVAKAAQDEPVSHYGEE